MYAIVIDGELRANGIKAGEVLKVLKQNELGEGLTVQVASFSKELRRWIPVCLENFLN